MDLTNLMRKRHGARDCQCEAVAEKTDASETLDPSLHALIRQANVAQETTQLNANHSQVSGPDASLHVAHNPASYGSHIFLSSLDRELVILQAA